MAHRAPTTNQQSNNETETGNTHIMVPHHKVALHQTRDKAKIRDTFGRATHQAEAKIDAATNKAALVNTTTKEIAP